MKSTTGLALVALGAIFAFAVNGHPGWLNIQAVGWVIMLTWGAGLLIPQRGYAAVRRRVVRRRAGPGGQVTEVDERRYPPYIRLNSGALAATIDPADLVASSDEYPGRRTEVVEEYLDS